MSPEPASEAVRVARGVHRASYEPEVVAEIVDAALIAHVGTVRDGAPVVIPMFCVRDGDTLLLHGAPASGVIRRGRGTQVCVTMTVLDGLVLARSAFHHSVNYRCAVVVGEAVEVTDADEKAAALDRFVEALVPGRSGDLRPMTDKEFRGTSVLRLSLAESSAKVRSGDPVDDDEDLELPIWAGVVPLEHRFGAPVDATDLIAGVDVPASVSALEGSAQ